MGARGLRARRGRLGVRRGGGRVGSGRSRGGGCGRGRRWGSGRLLLPLIRGILLIEVRVVGGRCGGGFGADLFGDVHGMAGRREVREGSGAPRGGELRGRGFRIAFGRERVGVRGFGRAGKLLDRHMGHGGGGRGRRARDRFRGERFTCGGVGDRDGRVELWLGEPMPGPEGAAATGATPEGGTGA